MFYERPEIQLIKALNSENPALQPPLQPDEVAFGLPQARATDPEYNTEVDILVSQNHPTHSGSVRVQYNRWDIEKLLYRLTVPGVIGQYRNTHEALAVLVEHFRLPLTTSDIVNLPIGAGDNRILFRATTGSLAVIGETRLYYRG